MELLDKVSLVAPCGMNCTLCAAYLRTRNKCPGCRGADAAKPVTRTQCRIKNCLHLKEYKREFCFQCDTFPCDKIKHLDKRYRAKYYMSMIENLQYIKKAGMSKFLFNENIRWTCSKCGGTICVHKGCCFVCGKPGKGNNYCV